MQEPQREIGAEALITRWIFGRQPNARLTLAYRVLYLRKTLARPSKRRAA